MEKEKLLRKYHMLVKRTGLSEDERRGLMKEWYGKESSKDLSEEELKDMCDIMERAVMPTEEEKRMDKQRKLLIKAISEYCKDNNRQYTIEQIKEIAERSSGLRHKNGQRYGFNEIPEQTLRRLTYYYKKLSKMWHDVIEESMNIVAGVQQRGDDEAEEANV